MKCKHCKIRKGIMDFSLEPMSAITRGYGSVRICRVCYIKIIEDELKRINLNLIRQKKLLNKERREE